MHSLQSATKEIEKLGEALWFCFWTIELNSGSLNAIKDVERGELYFKLYSVRTCELCTSFRSFPE